MQILAVLRNFIKSWRDSLKVFMPENFKLFFLLTVNSWRLLWQSLVTSGAIIYLLGIVIFSLIKPHWYDTPGYIFSTIAITLLVTATRPSVGYKNHAYYIRACVFGFIFECILAAGYFAFLALAHAISIPNWLYIIWSYISALFLFSSVWLPALVLLILFALDTQSTILAYLKSAVRAVVMLVYNYPFFLVTIVLFHVITRHITGLLNLVSQINTTSGQIVAWFIMFFYVGAAFSFYICFLTNFYIKRLHEQFELYYDKE